MAEPLAAIALGNVDAEERGARIARRQDRLGVTDSALAKVAGVDRGRIPKIRRGDSTVRATTFAAVERALDQLERELQMQDFSEDPEAESGGSVTMTVKGSLGLTTVTGSVEDVARLWHLMQVEPAQDDRPEVDPAVYGPIREAVAKRKSRRGAGEGGPDHPATQ